MSPDAIEQSPIVKNALESLKHFENFEKKIQEARTELSKSRNIQIKNRTKPHEETNEDRIVWEIYDKLSEIQYSIEVLKHGDEED